MKRDPRIEPKMGDVVVDKLGLLHVAGINDRPGVPSVSFKRQPTGMAKHETIYMHTSLTKWRKKVESAAVVEVAK
jgi:hypothetical protein